MRGVKHIFLKNGSQIFCALAQTRETGLKWLRIIAVLAQRILIRYIRRLPPDGDQGRKSRRPLAIASGPGQRASFGSAATPGCIVWGHTLRKHNHPRKLTASHQDIDAIKSNYRPSLLSQSAGASVANGEAR